MYGTELSTIGWVCAKSRGHRSLGEVAYSPTLMSALALPMASEGPYLGHGAHSGSLLGQEQRLRDTGDSASKRGGTQ